MAFLISSSEENRFPFNCLFGVGNAQKSHGAKAGLYGGCCSAVPPISVIAAIATAAICGRALSWSKNHCFVSKSGLSFLMAPRKWGFRTLGVNEVMWSELAWYMWSDFVLKWSEVKWVTLKFLGTKVPCTLRWPYIEGIWLYCDYFIWCVSCTVVVLTCFVMCGCVYVWVL